jgi:hypothetical protein
VNTPAIDESKLAGIVLRKGLHKTPEEGMCLMEVVAYVTGEEHTDRPACVAKLLGEMGRILNDTLPDDLRQLLIPVIPGLPGTAGDGLDLERSYRALDWLIRVCLPAWLDLSPACREVAEELRRVDRIVDTASAERAVPVVLQAQQTAAALNDSAGAATWDAAWTSVAWDAADAVHASGVAMWVTARAASDAVWAAAWDAVDAVDVADAARAAAKDAAIAGAWRAATGEAARDAAAATDALQPVVKALQISAIELFTRMARLGEGY